MAGGPSLRNTYKEEVEVEARVTRFTVAATLYSPNPNPILRAERREAPLDFVTASASTRRHFILDGRDAEEFHPVPIYH